MIYLICTPIGNLNDISLRSIEILKGSDFIFAEDTRKAKRLFRKFNIDKKSFSFNDHNERDKTKNIIMKAREGKIISILSDAGAPLISDPGYYLISECIKNGIRYSVIPGPSSVINSILLSGLATNKFIFLGFLPRKDKERKKLFSKYEHHESTLIFFESPKRLIRTLSVMKEIFSSTRQIAICREMTKIHEEVLRGSVREVLENISSRDIKGEICLVVEGCKEIFGKNVDLSEEVRTLLLENMSPSESARLLSLVTKKSKKDFYNWLIEKS